MKLFHTHKFIKRKLLDCNLVDDFQNPTYSKPYVACELYQCRCGEKKAEYYDYYGKSVRAIDCGVGIQHESLEWLTDTPRAGSVVKLKVVK